MEAFLRCRHCLQVAHSQVDERQMNIYKVPRRCSGQQQGNGISGAEFYGYGSNGNVVEWNGNI
jgi:hypothetical protein